MAKSIEEQVEDYFKTQLKKQKTKYFTKTESINSEIDNALKAAPSKSGGSGSNFPDIKLFIETSAMRKIPVMIEAKGTKGRLLKVTDNGEIDNYTKDGNPNFKSINTYAVNGAIHYANAIIEHTKSYREVLAIGLNGYLEGTQVQCEIGVYYVSQENYKIPKEVGKYSDLSFLASKNITDNIFCNADGYPDGYKPSNLTVWSLGQERSAPDAGTLLIRKLGFRLGVLVLKTDRLFFPRI